MNTVRILWLIALGGLGALYVIGFGVAVLINRLIHLRLHRPSTAPALKPLIIARHPGAQRDRVRRKHPPGSF
jgi:hypothetical protein